MAARTRHRGPFNMKLRYALTYLFGLAFILIFLALVLRRAELEPIIRALDPVLLGLRSAKPYVSDDYVLYVALAAFFGAMPFVVAAYEMATKAKDDQRIDAYLADRMPRHEISVPRNDE